MILIEKQISFPLFYQQGRVSFVWI